MDGLVSGKEMIEREYYFLDEFILVFSISSCCDYKKRDKVDIIRFDERVNGYLEFCLGLNLSRFSFCI